MLYGQEMPHLFFFFCQQKRLSTWRAHQVASRANLPFIRLFTSSTPDLYQKKKEERIRLQMMLSIKYIYI